MNWLTSEPPANRSAAAGPVFTRPSRWHGARAGAVAALALGLAACGGSSGSGASGGPATPAPAGATSPGQAAHVVFHGTIQVTGAVKTTTKWTQQSTAASCAASAAHGDQAGGGYKIPSPAAHGGPVIDIVVTGFHGAATYPPAAMKKDHADSVKLKSGGHAGTYLLTAPSVKAGHTVGKEVLFLNKDGSGQLAFSQAHKSGLKSAPQIAGVITWKCTD